MLLVVDGVGACRRSVAGMLHGEVILDLCLVWSVTDCDHPENRGRRAATDSVDGTCEG